MVYKEFSREISMIGPYLVNFAGVKGAPMEDIWIILSNGLLSTRGVLFVGICVSMNEKGEQKRDKNACTQVAEMNKIFFCMDKVIFVCKQKSAGAPAVTK